MSQTFWISLKTVYIPSEPPGLRKIIFSITFHLILSCPHCLLAHSQSSVPQLKQTRWSPHKSLTGSWTCLSSLRSRWWIPVTRTHSCIQCKVISHFMDQMIMDKKFLEHSLVMHIITLPIIKDLTSLHLSRVLTIIQYCVIHYPSQISVMAHVFGPLSYTASLSSSIQSSILLGNIGFPPSIIHKLCSIHSTLWVSISQHHFSQCYPLY